MIHLNTTSTTIQFVTGGGKTITFFSFAFDFLSSKSFLFLAPQINLAKQTAKQRHLEVGYIQGSSKRGLTKRVVIGTIQTVYNQGVLKDRFNINRFDYIFIDEAHKEEKKIKKLLSKLQPHQKVVFLTATPFNGKGEYKDYLSKNIIGSEFDYYYMIEKGYLVPLRIYQVGNLDTSNIKLNKDNEFNDKELYQAIKDSNIDIVQTSIKKIDRRFPTLVVAQNIKHAEELTEEYIQAGFRAKVIHSQMKDTKPDTLLKGLDRGDLDMLVSVKMLTTGIDIPKIGNLVLATKFGSIVEFIQFVGRGLRAFEGKTHCNLIDLFGTVELWGHPFDFKPMPPKETKKRKSSSNCPECKKGRMVTVEVKESDEEIAKIKVCNECGFENVDIIAKDIIECSCGYKGTEYITKKDKHIIYKLCPMCGDVAGEIGKIAPRELVLMLGNIAHTKQEIIALNNDRVNTLDLIKFLKFADKEKLAFLLEAFGYLGHNYSQSSISKIEKRIKEFNSRFNEAHEKLIELLDFDIEAFNIMLETAQPIHRLIARASQRKTRNLKSNPLKFAKSYANYLKNGKNNTFSLTNFKKCDMIHL
jgi:superfamily II DNA or RNA helicase